MDGRIFRMNFAFLKMKFHIFGRNIKNRQMNRKRLQFWIILLFATLHLLSCLACRSMGVDDEHALTLLTIAMVFILCYQREMKFFYIIATVIMVNVVAYMMGSALPMLFGPLMGDTDWVFAVSTFLTTFLLGVFLEFVTDILSKAARERASKLGSGFRQRWIVHLNDRIVPVKTEQIAYFFSEDKCNYLVTFEGSKFIIDSTMDVIMAGLDPSHFFRISRGAILSMASIDSATIAAGRYHVSIHPAIGPDMIVARARVDAFLSWLG